MKRRKESKMEANKCERCGSFKLVACYPADSNYIQIKPGHWTHNGFEEIDGQKAYVVCQACGYEAEDYMRGSISQDKLR